MSIRAVPVALVALLSLSACTVAEPARPANPAHDRPVNIVVSGQSTEQLVLGQLYHEVLAVTDRQSNLEVRGDLDPAGQLQLLRQHRADLTVSCTGTMLDQLHPQRAGEIAGEVGEGEDPNAGDLSQLTYDEFLGALPGDLITTDPSPTQACGGEGELPQNIVPLFGRELFDRTELRALNEAARLLTDADLAEMIEQVKDSERVSEVVGEWVASQPI